MSFMDVDVVEFLEDLGVQNVQDNSGDEVSFSCPFDGHSRGDSIPSATMHRRTTGFNCFGCGKHGNAINFLSEMEGIPYHRAKRYIRERFSRAKPLEGSVSDEVERILSDKPKAPVFLDEREQEIRSVVWKWASEAIMAGDLKPPGPFTYMLVERRFRPAVLQSWEIGFDVVSEHWITIPYRDVMGRLLGFKGRTWDPEQRIRYKVLGGGNYPFDTFEMSKHVFGLNRINYVEHLYVCEGELNAIMMNQRGYAAVGFSGQFLTDVQAGLIASRADRVTLVMDDIDKAFKAAIKLYTKIPVLIVPPHDKDPCDLTPEELEDLTQAASNYGMMTLEGK